MMDEMRTRIVVGNIIGIFLAIRIQLFDMYDNYGFTSTNVGFAIVSGVIGLIGAYFFEKRSGTAFVLMLLASVMGSFSIRWSFFLPSFMMLGPILVSGKQVYDNFQKIRS